MNARALLRLAIQNVVRNPTRSILTMLGVMIGVAAVIIMVAIGQGAQGAIEERIKNLGTNMIVITPGVATTAGVSGGAQSMPSLTIEDADLLRKDAQSLVAVSPVVMTRTTVVGGQANWRASIYGVDPSYAEIRDWQVASGRFIDELDIKGRKKVCVLGATVASRVFGEDDPVGQLVRLRDVPIEVIGVLKAKGQTAEGADQDDVVLAPYSTVQTRLAGRQFIGQILGSASSPDQLDLAQSEVKLILRERHGLSESQPDDFEVRDQRQLAETATSTTQVMTTLLSAIASVSLLVGGIGIMNIMLVSVTERTREIGIRRALGARRGDVLAQFLVEAMVLSGLGGLIGAGVGVGGAWGVGRLTGWATTVTPSTVVLAVLFSAGVGVVFGWTPARRAAGLDPIDALRHQ
ncbi:ABC transporter permease [Myxococcota bacterium]|nr:ABC transporter permease [Myxococcota bacterium]